VAAFPPSPGDGEDFHSVKLIVRPSVWFGKICKKATWGKTAIEALDLRYRLAHLVLHVAHWLWRRRKNVHPH
jgi:hypothetical protein